MSKISIMLTNMHTKAFICILLSTLIPTFAQPGIDQIEHRLEHDWMKWALNTHKAPLKFTMVNAPLLLAVPCFLPYADYSRYGSNFTQARSSAQNKTGCQLDSIPWTDPLCTPDRIQHFTATLTDENLAGCCQVREQMNLIMITYHQSVI